LELCIGILSRGRGANVGVKEKASASNVPILQCATLSREDANTGAEEKAPTFYVLALQPTIQTVVDKGLHTWTSFR